MVEGQQPKLPLFMRAIAGSWCENSAIISEGVMGLGFGFGFGVAQLKGCREAI